MPDLNIVKTRKEMIEQVRQAGLSIINHAEDIVGESKGLLTVEVSFLVKRDYEEQPTIEIKRKFIPDDIFTDETKEE